MKRAILVTTSAVLLLESLHLLLLIYPHPFFTEYYHDDRIVIYTDGHPGLDAVSLLDSVYHRLAGNEIYNGAHSFNVFLCSSRRRYALFAWLAGMDGRAQGMNILPADNIFVSLPAVHAVRSGYGPPAYRHSLLEGSVLHVLSHEMMHTFISEKVGYWNSRSLPVWKVEGYAEFGLDFLIFLMNRLDWRMRAG